MTVQERCCGVQGHHHLVSLRNPAAEQTRSIRKGDSDPDEDLRRCKGVAGSSTYAPGTAQPRGHPASTSQQRTPKSGCAGLYRSKSDFRDVVQYERRNAVGARWECSEMNQGGKSQFALMAEHPIFHFWVLLSFYFIIWFLFPVLPPLEISGKIVGFLKAPSMDFLSKLIKLSSLRREERPLRGGSCLSPTTTRPHAPGGCKFSDRRSWRRVGLVASLASCWMAAVSRAVSAVKFRRVFWGDGGGCPALLLQVMGARSTRHMARALSLSASLNLSLLVAYPMPFTSDISG